MGLEFMHNIAIQLGGYFWNVVVVLACFLGVYFSIKTKFVQFRLFPETMRLIKDRIFSKEKVDGVSGFQAFCVTLGGCIGTGNVAGVAMAIVVGGPGVIPWMWLIALLGAGISFVENTLAQVYKSREGDIYRGGPMYYMCKGLGNRVLGSFYAVVMIISLGFALVGLQTNTIALSVGGAFKLPNYVTAGIVAILIALIIFGGVKRIASVAEKGVPIMTIIYVAMLIMVIVTNISSVPEALGIIFRESVSAKAVTGATFSTIFIQGIKRGVFSCGSGHGDAPTTGASSTVSHPVKQGLFGALAVYVDTCVVCTATALVIVISGVYTGSGLVGIELSQFAFTTILGGWSSSIFAICICMFCFTSIMANYYCGETCLTYLTSNMRGRNLYRVLFVIVIFLGGITQVNLMWDIADVFLAIMIIANMVSLIFIGKKVIVVIDDYTKQKKEGKDPVFDVKNVEGITNAECWDN